MFTRPSVSGERKAANLCKSTLQLKKRRIRNPCHILRERDLIWIIYHTNILPIWQNVSNQIKQCIYGSTKIAKNSLCGVEPEA